MPQYQEIAPDAPHPLAAMVGTFLDKTVERQNQKREGDVLGNIYRKYQNNGRKIDDLLNDIRSNPELGPTAKANAASDYIKMHELNNKFQAEEMKYAKKAQEESLKNANQQKAVEALKQAGATPEQISLYEAAPVGGQTKIVEDIIETKNRSKPPVGLGDGELIDYDSGLTPKERVKRQDERFSKQTPLVMANNKELTSLENENLSLDLLGELNDSGKVGQGLGKLNINPKTGDLIIPQFATPEEQLFVKTVNDFTVKAKDSFGARVTNFELDRFMQRLPTLANSPEGRALILRQMKIVNELNALEKRGIQDVFDQYGIRNIDYADASTIARNKMKDESSSLKKEYLNIESLARKQEEAFNKKLKGQAKEGYTVMQKPDGTFKQYPNASVEDLQSKGFRRL